MSGRRTALAAAGLGALALLGLALAAGRPDPAPGDEGAGALAAPAPPPAAAEAPPVLGGLPPLPESLRGTDPGGALRADADGRFVPEREALALFDYYFSASGEEPDDVIRARIHAEIRARLPASAVAGAEAFFASYLAYRAAAETLFATEPASDDFERRFQRIREIRREAFGAGVAAELFAEEERVTEVDLERRRVAQDASLSREERERRLAALDAELPDAERAARAEVRQAVDLRAAEAALRAAGAGDAEIDAERERRVGPEAAARLAALDAQRAEWRARVEAWRAERDALRARGASETEVAAARDERFTAQERLRLDALERRGE